jgi:hypothetical protein
MSSRQPAAYVLFFPTACCLLPAADYFLLDIESSAVDNAGCHHISKLYVTTSLVELHRVR